MHSADRRDVARQRWRLLGKALAQATKGGSGILNNGVASNDVSVRRFSSYGLLSSKLLPGGKEKDQYAWMEYSCPSLLEFSVCIRHLKKNFSPKELMGFNNTGNVCVWPSEEILAYHCLQNRDMFKEKTVCELGGGMTCLAGVAVASTCVASRVILTDGNDLSCENVGAIVEKNREIFANTKVNVRYLRWNEAASFTDLRECVDVIICADCLFFDQYRADLVDTIHSLLTPAGTAVIFAPRRGSTLEKFCQEAKIKFDLTLEERYDPRVWQVYQQAKTKGKEIFDEDIHYPLKLTLTKTGASHHRNLKRKLGNGVPSDL